MAIRWLGAFFLYKLVVFSIAYVSLYLIPKTGAFTFEHFINLFYQWDAKHFLRVAMAGYDTLEPSIQVFPLYPALIRLIKPLIGNWIQAGFAVAQIASFFAFYFLYKLARLDLGENESKVALILFAMFPTAYFLSAPYTEPLFCALTFGGIYFARTDRFAAAALLCLGASLTRYTGLLLAPALGLHWYFCRQRLKREQTLGFALATASVLAGFAGYLALNKYYFNEWFYYLDEQSKHWDMRLTPPFAGALRAVSYWKWSSGDYKISYSLAQLATMAFALLALVPVFRSAHQKRFYVGAIWMSLNLALFSCLSLWMSHPRFILTLYPMYIALAPWFSRSPLRLGFYGLTCAGMFAMFWALYLSAQWAF